MFIVYDLPYIIPNLRHASYIFNSINLMYLKLQVIHFQVIHLKNIIIYVKNDTYLRHSRLKTLCTCVNIF